MQVLLAQYGSDVIKQFTSNVQVQKDGTLCVTETFVYATVEARRGIARSFPTLYSDSLGNKVRVDFTIKKILQDGAPVDYTTEKITNGVRVRIGNPAVYLKPGLHTYTLEYSTNRKIGFFKDHDELSWAATGYAWKIPLEQAQVSIKLPENIPAHVIQTRAFAGPESRSTQEVVIEQQSGNVIQARTLKPLAPYEGLKLFVEWPKGYIAEPTVKTKVFWFLRDNLVGLWLTIGSIMLLVYYAYVYRRVRPQSGVIIPLFEPPAGFSPQAVRFMVKKQYDNVAFAAELVDLAVHRFLTIDYQEGFFRGTYTLIKNPQDQWISKPTREQELLFDALFGTTTKLTLSQAQGQHVARAMSRAAAYLDGKLNYKYIESHSGYVGGGLALTGLIIAPTLYYLGLGAFEIIALVLLALVNIVYFFLLQVYTQAGRKIMDHIEGFKLFLATTETERLKVIGTPPTKNPELYEKYLPYAIALGVEKQWAAQFAPVFKRLEAQGQVYKPIWYSGNRQFGNFYFNPAVFTSTVAHTMPTYTYSTSGSKTAPGTYSDRSGGGSYGGGGGGEPW